MTAPNLANPTTVNSKTALDADIAATAATLLTCATDHVYRITSLIIANIDGVDNSEITVDIYRSSTAYEIASSIVVPAQSSVVIISKDAGINLEEGDALRLTAEAAGELSAICAYEDIS